MDMKDGGMGKGCRQRIGCCCGGIFYRIALCRPVKAVLYCLVKQIRSCIGGICQSGQKGEAASLLPCQIRIIGIGKVCRGKGQGQLFIPKHIDFPVLIRSIAVTGGIHRCIAAHLLSPGIL